MENDLQQVKEEVRARTDIVEIIGGYTRLKRTGKNWTGLCPFHNDRKPSFSVVPALGIYKCFSCGEGGDLFTFVQKKENLEFIDALEWLARRAGIPFERGRGNPEQASKRKQALELNGLALRFFQDRLAKSQDAKDYLARRGILKSTQEQWDIGFAPPEWDALAYALQQRRADLDLATEIGLIRPRRQEGSGYYDAYRARVIFPIRDINGDVIGFGGRVMNPDEEPKYLNSADSFLFPKSRTLYGLYFARKKLSGETPPVFVEGYVDVITAHQAGFAQCVATLGTSMTEDHARMLSKISPRVIICYDGDKAGVNATLKGAGIWEGLGIENGEVRVARLPAGEDPDSLLRKGETAAFQAALDTAVPRVDFQIELALKRHDLNADDGRDAALAEAIPIIASVRSLTARDRYAQRIAFLHPSHSYNLGRAIEQILADADLYARQTKQGHSPRAQGYPLTEQSNRAPLQEQPDPPTYRPPNPQQWGQTGSNGWPHTRQVIGKGEGAGGGQASHDGYGKGKWGKNRRPEGPPTDSTPPSLAPQALTAVEKAERQLLRALFSPDWRVTVLNSVREEWLVTEQGRWVYAWAARTPAQADGSLDPGPLLRMAVEAESEKREREERDGEEVTRHAAEHSGEDRDGTEVAPQRISGIKNANNATSGQHSAKFSEFIRELLEESPFFVSNDTFTEATVQGCLSVLQKHRNERELHGMRTLIERLEQARTPEERRVAKEQIEQYHQKMRAMRGTPGGIANGQDAETHENDL
jgi:DNA primase